MNESVLNAFKEWETKESPKKECKKCKIMVVDDEPSVVSGLESHLSNYEIVFADSGEKALNLVDKYTYCIIMDAKMPRMSGFETTREIKKNFPNVPIIMHTGYQNEHTITEVVEHDFKGYFDKGDDPKRLVRKIEEACKIYSIILDNEKYQKELASQNINSILSIILVTERKNQLCKCNTISAAMFADYIARQKNYDYNQRVELFEAVLIRDIGFLSLSSPTLLPKQNPSKYEDEYSNYSEHTKIGAELVKEHPYFSKYRQVISFHHSWYSDLLNDKIKENELLWIVAIGDTVAYKEQRRDINRGELWSIIKYLGDEAYLSGKSLVDKKLKFNPRIFDGITLHTFNRDNAFWKDSIAFVFQQINDRKLLRFFEVDKPELYNKVYQTFLQDRESTKTENIPQSIL